MGTRKKAGTAKGRTKRADVELARTRLRLAAQRFVDELVDVIMETTGLVLETEEMPAPRSPRIREPPPVKGPIDPEAARRARDALAKLGIRT